MHTLHNLTYYERMIKLYEGGKRKLDDDDLIGLADEILGFDQKEDWYTDLHYKYTRSCDKIKDESNPEKLCELCSKLTSGECDYTRAMGLAVYVYNNLVNELPPDREILCSFLEGELCVYDNR